MDFNFTNVFEGTRQYFQGLPKASPGGSVEDGCQSDQMAVVQSTWPVPVSATPPCRPASRPPSAANVSAPPASLPTAAAPPPPAPAPPPTSVPQPSDLPERPPSEALIEPEPHIIHKATVMQQAQQKQNSYVNMSADLERPPSTNMISPPTHIIHKSRYIQDHPPVHEENRQTPKEEPRIPPHFAVTEGTSYPQPPAATKPQPVLNKYSSHLPTPPQPSIHNSSHYHSRLPGSNQQRNYTILQSRPVSRPTAYSGRGYPSEMPHVPGSSAPLQRTTTTATTTSSGTYPQQPYEMMKSVPPALEARRPSSITDTYLQSASQLTTLHSPQKPAGDHQQHYPRSMGMYNYHHQNQSALQTVEQNKTATNGPGPGLKGYAHTIQMQQQQQQQQKSRALPASKPSNVQPPMQSSRQYPYSQKMSTQQSQAALYHRSQSSHYIPNSHPTPQDNAAQGKHPHYDYANRLSHHKVAGNPDPSPGPVYQERITPLPPEQRHNSPSTHPAYPPQPNRGVPHAVDVYNSRVQPAPVHHSTKISSDYHSQPLKTQQQVYSPSSANHYAMLNHNSVNTSASYQIQTTYQSTTSVVKHSYEPKTSTSVRSFTTKQNMSMHQPRMTVSVTTLVNQMNARQQTGSRQDLAVSLVTKQKKESPLDLSVKTVRIPADSTAQDEMENYDKNFNHNNREAPGLVSNLLNIRQRTQHKPNNISGSHKVDFLPNFNTEKVTVYRESNPAYVQSKKMHYDQNNSGVLQHYVNKTTSVQYNNRYDSKSTFGSQNFARRVDQNLPKIDLTSDIDHVDRRMHAKEDARKRDASYYPNPIPQKMPRNETWSYERHGRPETVQMIPNQYKTVNGTNLPDHQSNNIYKKSESIEPYKYHHLAQYRHPSPQVNDYYHQKAPVYQNYDYNNYPDKSVTKQEAINPAIYNNHYSTPPANKKVLSLLRNSLEAKNVENQKMIDNSDDCIIIQSDDNSMHSSDFNEVRTKKSRHSEYQNGAKHNVITENQSYKLHIPRAVDSIKFESESPSQLLKMRDELKSSIEQLKNDLLDASMGSSDHSQSSEVDAAARIRTKAELKGFTQSNSVKNKEETPKEVDKPEPHRRRLFSKSDPNVPSDNHRNSKASVIRSSSESVFDFPDSGSECETSPIEKRNNNSILPIANVKIEKEDDDPFWAEACDSFMEQLKNGKGKKLPRKKKSVIAEKANLDIVKIEKTAVINVVDIIKSESANNNKEELKKTDKPCSDSSDEDQPLKLLKEINSSEKKRQKSNANSTPSKKNSKTKSAEKNKLRRISSDDEQLSLKKIKKENPNQLPSYNGSDSESDNVLIANKRRLRKVSSFPKTLEEKTVKVPNKEALKIKEDNWNGKKPGFGDGSDFRPGWEEEVYKYKRSLRMPASLINVSRLPHWPRVSSSLPDLDPCPNSPALSSSTEELFSNRLNDKNNKDDSDAESLFGFSNNRKSNYDSEASCSTVISTASKKVKGDTSILDLLIQKYSTKSLKKNKLKYDSPKIIPKSENPVELLATPSLEMEKNVDTKGLTTVQSKEKMMRDLFYVGSFRQETVSTFRDAFINNTDGLLGATREFSPVVLKSRTRTETRVLKKRATIKEVFGDERPASAPPLPYREEEEMVVDEEPKEPAIEIKSNIPAKKIKKEISFSVIREGLRSSRLLRKSDSKGRLLRMRKRNNILKFISSKKIKATLTSPTVKIKIKKEIETTPPEETDKIAAEKPVEEESPPHIPMKKAFRRLFPRRKLSSGFDYIRKKKKQIKKDDTVKKRSALPRPSPESVHDIQREIKGWIINKGIGESVLHRAARLGYTDCVAYCLEKMDLPPSVRDNAGYTALHEACSRGHLDIARLLLQYGANVSAAAQGGIRPLHEACENGYIEIIRLLLSYGADPLLATYSGQTPISLSGGKAARLLQLHLQDVQGNIPQAWQFNGPCKLLDPIDNGYDPLSMPPPGPSSPPPPQSIEFTTTTAPLPPLYRLKPSNHSNATDPATPDTGLWCLLQDLSALLQVKSRDALLKQIHCGPGPPRESLKELRMQEFLDRAQCQQLMSAGEKINIRASKIALVRYTEKVKQLLNIDTVLVR